MPRTARSIVAGGCYHVINRGNNRATIFHSPGEYDAFVGLLIEAQARIWLSVLSACLMPNHFHLVVSPDRKDDVSRWMQWLLTTHAHRHHLRHGSSGRVWQGRFKAFPIERDEHLLAVMRYVERNALRAGLVERAEDWPWSSLAWRSSAWHRQLIAAPPVALPADWIAEVNRPQSATETQALRACVNRQRPFGGDAWVAATTGDLGLEASGRDRGRPRKCPRPVQAPGR